jgi:uncharacterized protein (TIGR03000 family)
MHGAFVTPSHGHGAPIAVVPSRGFTAAPVVASRGFAAQPVVPFRGVSAPVRIGFPVQSFPLGGPVFARGFRPYGGFLWGGYGWDYPYTSPYDYGYLPYDYGYTPVPGGYTANLSSMPSFYQRGLTQLPPLANNHPTTAQLELRVPNGAEVFVQGKKVDLRGTSQTFESPELKPDETFTFDIRVVWTDNGKSVEEKRTLVMKPGDRQSLQFIAIASAPIRVER